LSPVIVSCVSILHAGQFQTESTATKGLIYANWAVLRSGGEAVVTGMDSLTYRAYNRFEIRAKK
jgi:hypothetical protein